MGNWCAPERRRSGDGAGALSEDERAELVRLRRENAKLAMQRDVLKGSVALWFKRRWAGKRGRVHCRPEGRASGSARDELSGVGGVPGLVLQVVPRRSLPAAFRRERLTVEIRRLFAA